MGKVYLTKSGGNRTTLTDIESADYPGCYCRIVDGVPEWVNPPMIPGVEYRTTERYFGRAVYQKLINLGALPPNGVARYTGVFNYYDILDLQLYVKSDISFRGISGYGSSRASVWAEEYHNIAVLTTDLSDTTYYGYALAKYTKEAP